MIRPIGKRVILKAQTFKAEQISETGIVLSTEGTNSGADSTKATILSIGDEVTKVKVGDEIFYETHGGHKVTMDGEEVIILQEINILGVITDG